MREDNTGGGALACRAGKPGCLKIESEADGGLRDARDCRVSAGDSAGPVTAAPE